MTDKKDGEPTRPEGQEQTAAPRPHAMLDLTAMEVKDQAAGEAAPPADAPPDAPADDQTTQPQPRSPSDVTSGSALTHLLAGLAGGALVLAGVYMTGGGGPASPLQDAESSVRLAAVEKRVQALEAAPAGGGGEANGGLTQKITDAEGRLARLEETSNALKDAQGRLAGETQALAAKVGEGGSEAESARLAKLEERLNLLSEAAGSGNAQVPELAALTGKIAELEAALASQGGQAAQAVAERLDREIQALKSEAAQLKDRLTADLAAVRGRADTLATKVGDLESGLKRTATPGDVSAAVSPVAGKVEAIERTLYGVVRSEQERTASARRIVLALELMNLKRSIDRGQPYAAELAAVRKVAAPGVDLSALDRWSHDGVPTLAELEREFRAVMHAVLDADAEPETDSIMDRLVSGAKSVVRVRRIAHPSGDLSAEAAVARIEAALKDGRIGDVIAEARAVPPKASGPLQDWLSKVEARHAADRAIAAIEDDLKTSLTGAPAEPAPPPAN